jgi:serine protease AprX
MDRIAKVYSTGSEQTALAKTQKTLERYPAFLLIKVSGPGLVRLARKYPVEDITDLFTIRAGEKSINTSRPRVDTMGKRHAHAAYADAKPLPPGKHHYLVQFVGPIKSAWLKSVKHVGGEPRAPYENFAYVVRANDKQLGKVAALSFVRWVGHLPYRARLASAAVATVKGKRVVDLPRTHKLPGVYTMEFFGAEDLRAGLSAVKKLGFQLLHKDAKAKVLLVKASGAAAIGPKLDRLSAIHGVRAIRERVLKRTSNDVAAGIMGTASTWNQSGLGLSGKGETIGICDTGLDTGDPATIHPDFAGRIAWIKSYPITPDFNTDIKNPGGNDGPADLDSGHGTHVTGSVLGSGAVSRSVAGVDVPIRGLAYNAKLVFQAVEQELQWKDPLMLKKHGRYSLAGIPTDLGTLFADAYNKGARIHSNSWGGGAPGEYDEQCQQLDQFIWKRKTFCIVVAAGNDGTDKDGDGKINPMSISSPAPAKNAITVGASENLRPIFNSNTYGSSWSSDYPVAPFHNDPMADNIEEVVPFSSRGPTLDGRIKPDVVAPGTYILSTRSTQIALNNQAWAAFPKSKMYFHMGGTSMATPLVAGALGLIREYLRKDQHISSPSAALLKAALILGAQRLPGNGSSSATLLDNHQGYGRVNLDAVLAPEKPASAIFNDVKSGLKTGALQAFTLKVKSNQVPLRIVLAYSDYPGPALVNNLNLMVTDPSGIRYVGNQSAGNLTMDVKNNVEVVQVPRPVSGTWKIEVVGSNVPQGPQPFALAWLAHA